MRRKSKVNIQIPSKFASEDWIPVVHMNIRLVFVDKNTPRPFHEDLSVYGDQESVSMDDRVYLDAMGFGMGCCCLQVTFQAQSIDEARFLYDQLTPLTPIMVNTTRVFVERMRRSFALSF